MGVERLGREANHIPLTSVKVNDVWNYICPTPNDLKAFKGTTLHNL